MFCAEPDCLWVVEITRGYAGNYEHEYTYWESWRTAYDAALRVARAWRCQCWSFCDHEPSHV